MKMERRREQGESEFIAKRVPRLGDEAHTKTTKLYESRCLEKMSMEAWNKLQYMVQRRSAPAIHQYAHSGISENQHLHPPKCKMYKKSQICLIIAGTEVMTRLRVL